MALRMITEKLRAISKSPKRGQPLEEELRPVIGYLSGAVLNAGCGDRNIDSYLLSNGATSVENCDIKTKIPNSFKCELSSIPRPADTYDSILCNAVLEHVRSPSTVIYELRRVLKPGGCLVLCVPFLQPYHCNPTDYQRYTKDGLAELGLSHGFDVVTVLPVHSFAQTLSALLWEYLSEKNRPFAKFIAWFPLYLWCRMSSKTDFSLVNNANAYQIALKKK